jgi:hypothetical protein
VALYFEDEFENFVVEAHFDYKWHYKNGHFAIGLCT